MAKNESNAPEIFFHVGTSKTGTTFLQHRIFQHFKGVHYLKGKRNRKAIPIIQKGEHPRYLLSDEFDRQFEEEVANFGRLFPQTRPIIVFRRHDSYIASQYRRFVKNGYTGSFKEFFDLKNDQGYFKIKHLNYSFQIEYLRKHFRGEPIVLIYEDLRADPLKFIQELAEALSVEVDPAKLNLNKKHTSYNEKQLKGIKALGRYINYRKRRVFKNGVLHFFWRLYMGAVRYATLFILKQLPESFFPEEPLIAPEELQAVQAYFAKDWEQTKLFALEHKGAQA